MGVPEVVLPDVFQVNSTWLSRTFLEIWVVLEILGFLRFYTFYLWIERQKEIADRKHATFEHVSVEMDVSQTGDHQNHGFQYKNGLGWFEGTPILGNLHK